ncbi:D-alanyl-D-alanine carboxypeptidase / D-alanyl-D-alanine-endopeptidase (penicillin-binding protein 4) [Gilliamella bombicola]|uniref:D-alanyl-D-alanine carboxypeptidase / D-alanyl-D-alanine-endopeptidase (Penicillin-binding protein 4) n=1 Tax=Gilliamella bombicola TaxID=1798182 RepID=A0A1C4AYU8_9GAMM|nr:MULTISPECIES: serine-type D-Ala-D-Ala carboxypeptidase [Gilliamella]NUF26485.1 serine-type D-Ala-D-Ala carboxypeptidase [Gilliamella sp. ESL0254]SCB99793.1 D-alanyl-D-alanine carboxypeptidase / D-alanyl-D-alanine-endopeptidase (penicillin-binding protein 4) [Gilliamella bombicola]
MTKFKIIILFLLPFFTGFLYALSVEPYISSLPKGSDLSILVQSVESKPKTLAKYKSDQFKQPASTQKVITALAAELELGRDFRFITRMQTNGSISNKQLNGDLIIQLSGDPTFTREKLKNMIIELRKKGIEKIAGNVILDTSIFTSHDKAEGWSWNNLTACYSAPPSAAIIDDNCFYASVIPGKIGGQATISTSSNIPVQVTGNVKTIAKNSKDINDKYCELDVTYSDKNRYHLSGCIAASSDKTALKFAVINGVEYFSTILKNELKQQKITYTGSLLEHNQRANTQLTLLASSQSELLSELLTVMLKKSNNLYADAIFRTLGAHYYNVQGTWRNGGDAVKQILLKKAGINLENLVIVDGSGLSRLNLVSADKLMEILQYIAAHNTQLRIIEMLPIAGVDGTLQNRKSFNQAPFKETIRAKTGYIQGCYNLAGFIQKSDGKYVAFVQLLSGYHADSQSEPQNSAIMRFESEFYKNFIN